MRNLDASKFLRTTCCGFGRRRGAELLVARHTPSAPAKLVLDASKSEGRLRKPNGKLLNLDASKFCQDTLAAAQIDFWRRIEIRF
jgi:hypothetical protein